MSELPFRPKLQRIASWCKKFRLPDLNSAYTKRLSSATPLPPWRVVSTRIFIDQNLLKGVHHFTYLVSTVSSYSKIDKEVDNRLTNTNAALRDCKWACSNSYLKKKTHKYQHIIMYRSEKVNALLYDAIPCVRMDVILLECLFQLIPTVFWIFIEVT